MTHKAIKAPSTPRTVWSWEECVAKSNLKATTKLVLYTLSYWMNKEGGGCYPSIEKIAEYSSLSRRAVITNIALAAEAGFIRKRLHGFAGQKWKNNEYIACFPEITFLDVDNDHNDPIPHRPDGAAGDRHYASELNALASSEGGAFNDKKVVQQVHTILSTQPIQKESKNKYIKGNSLGKAKADKYPLAKWEEITGSVLCMNQVRSWIRDKKLDQEKIPALIEEFRERMAAGGNLYADFVSAFQVWLRSGYLSKTMDQVKLTDMRTGGVVIQDKGVRL